MKCPKCGYLGFETGDRCKNCGYDFSLTTPSPAAVPDPDLTIQTDDADTRPPELWLDRMDRTMDEVTRPSLKQDHLIGVPEPSVVQPGDTPDHSLPLFNPDDPDDIPLIALPASPRAPLAVRRTPETPRLRAVPKATRMPSAALDFREEPLDERRDDLPPSPLKLRSPATASAAGVREVGGRRLVAALIDHSILLAIDVSVLYFTARMAGVDVREIRLLPLPPLAVFLALLKLTYFTAFTSVGGQTIGKMAVGIRVVADRGTLDSTRAIRRTLAGVVSVLTLGIGFLPAFFGSDRRTLHDRLTGTRVVGLPSA